MGSPSSGAGSPLSHKEPCVVMTVRTATQADIPGIVRLIQALAQHDGVPAPDSRSLREVLQTLLRRESTQYIVAVDDAGLVIGTMQLDFRLTTWEAATYAYIEDFFVEEQHRGQGVGSAMLQLARQLSRQWGCVRMDLDVLQSSVDTRRFYERHGFENQGRLILRLTI